MASKYIVWINDNYWFHIKRRRKTKTFDVYLWPENEFIAEYKTLEKAREEIGKRAIKLRDKLRRGIRPWP